jgi:hypothetical protein
MSYDINLLDPITKEVIEINDAHFLRGGTYKMGGSTELSLNVTYNYSQFLHQVIQPESTPSEDKSGIRSIYGMTALEAIPILETAISNLKDDVVDDYWQPTEGNTKRALNNLLTMCKMRPDAIIDGD